MKTFGTCKKDPQLNSAHQSCATLRFTVNNELESSETLNINRAVSKYFPQDIYALNDPRDKFVPFPILTLEVNETSL